MNRLILVVACLASSAWAEEAWLSIVGDPSDPTAETIEMNPIAVARKGPLRVMEIRVSRAQERTSGDGIKFRSFRGEVGFDCSLRTARFLRSEFYAEPLWKSPITEMRYPDWKIRPMAFRGFEPNPRDKVIRAACNG